MACATRIRLGLLTVATSCSFAFSFSSTIGGYVEELPFLSFAGNTPTHVDNLLQFRLNTQWYPWEPLAIEASGRALCYGGQDFKDAELIATQLREDPGYVGLSWAQSATRASTVLYENVDRLSVAATKGSLSATLGRQRINWGTNLVWNPNDWFNAFNYLDFAYPEHPGTDALRLQYYPNPTSVAEIALQAGKSQSDRTFAALYKLNKWAYDWQFQAGLSGNDLATGFSWAGSIKGGGFRGEVSWYDPLMDRAASDKQTVVASISGDYTFSNSLYLQVAALYNGYGSADSSSVVLTSTSRVTAKSLIPKRYALFGEVAYQLTPLVRIDLSGSQSPTDGSFFLSPSITISVLNNLDLVALGQVFHGKNGDLYGGAADVVTASLKWSF